MKRVLVLLALLATATGSYAVLGVAAEEELEQATSLAEKHWNRESSRVIQVEPIASKKVAEDLQGFSIFRVKVKRDEKSGPWQHTYALALKDSKPAYLESEDDVVDFLTKHKRAVTDVGVALARVLVFVEIREYEMQLSPRAEKNLVPEDKAADPEDWKLVITETEDGWDCECILLVVKSNKFCCRYSFTVDRDGNLTLKKGEPVFHTGLHRIH